LRINVDVLKMVTAARTSQVSYFLVRRD